MSALRIVVHVRLLVLVSALVLTGGQSMCSAQRDSMNIVLEMQSDSIYYGQALVAGIQVINLTDRVLSVVSPSIVGNLRFLNESGFDFTSAWIRITRSGWETEPLAPGDTLLAWQVVVPEYPADTTGSSQICRQLKSTHTLKAVLAFRATSNLIPFELRWPPTEHRPMFDSLAVIINCLGNREDRKTGLARLESLRRLSPESIYRGEIERLILRFAIAVKDTQRVIAQASAIIRDDPESIVSLEAFDRLRRFTTQEYLSSLVSSVESMSPGSRIAGYYQNVKRRSIDK